MSDEPAEMTKWDPGFTRQITSWVGPVIKRYFRAEVRGMDCLPAAGGALVVSNHSGGMLTPDVLVFAPQFYGHFGFDRPLYTLAHYGVFMGPLGDYLRKAFQAIQIRRTYRHVFAGVASRLGPAMLASWFASALLPPFILLSLVVPVPPV